MRRHGFSFVLLPLCLALAPMQARAQGSAPELFGVREVVVDYARFVDPKAADSCNLSREKIASVLAKSLEGTTVPAIAALDAKPPVIGVARIQLVPQIASHMGENFDCVSWISLSAESRAAAVIAPITTLRSFTAVYWHQQVKAASGASTHPQLVGEILQKMATQFAQQYRLDQPPALSQ